MGYYENKKLDLTVPQIITENKRLNPFTNKDSSKIVLVEYLYRPIITTTARTTILELNKTYPNTAENFMLIDNAYYFVYSEAVHKYKDEIITFHDNKTYTKELASQLEKTNHDKYDFFNNTNRNDYLFEDKFNYLVEAQYKNNFHSFFSEPETDNQDIEYLQYIKIADELKHVIQNIARLNFIEFLKNEIKNSIKNIESFECKLTPYKLAEIFKSIASKQYIDERKNDVTKFIDGLITDKLTINTMILNWEDTNYSFIIFIDELKEFCKPLRTDKNICLGHFLIKDKTFNERTVRNARSEVKKNLKLENPPMKGGSQKYTQTNDFIKNLFL